MITSSFITKLCGKNRFLKFDNVFLLKIKLVNPVLNYPHMIES